MLGRQFQCQCTRNCGGVSLGSLDSVVDILEFLDLFIAIGDLCIERLASVIAMIGSRSKVQGIGILNLLLIILCGGT